MGRMKARLSPELSSKSGKKAIGDKKRGRQLRSRVLVYRQRRRRPSSSGVIYGWRAWQEGEGRKGAGHPFESEYFPSQCHGGPSDSGERTIG